MIEFLESLGITRGNKPAVCAVCGAQWPYCKWSDIVDEAPCREPAARKAETPKGENDDA